MAVVGVLCLVVIAAVILPGPIAAIVGPPLDRAKARRVLGAAKTPEELRRAVGSLGKVFMLKDGAWVAVRYTDSHSAGYSCAVALDSGGRWLYSSRHFCGRFGYFDPLEKRTRELAAALGETAAELDAALKKQAGDLYGLATAATLDVARAELLKIGFSE